MAAGILAVVPPVIPPSAASAIHKLYLVALIPPTMSQILSSACVIVVIMQTARVLPRIPITEVLVLTKSVLVPTPPVPMFPTALALARLVFILTLPVVPQFQG